MKIAFIARATLYKFPGGITIHVTETAKHLRKLGVQVTIHPADDDIRYKDYDLLHFFDIIRPANILHHIKKSSKPFVITPILIDYSEYDKIHRKGFSGFIFRQFSGDTNEYIKTVLRWLLGKDKLPGKSYLWRGQKKSVAYILRKTAMVLPNSEKENEQLKNRYCIAKPYKVVPNGIDATMFQPDDSVQKNDKLVLCAARIEGLKNQYNLIKALNHTEYRLLIIGDAAPNQKNYFKACRKIAAPNIEFTGHISRENLKVLYKQAKVHILPSWFETCGLSSLEAAAMGCQIVITDKGYTREYFGDDAFYCEPGNPESIYQAVKKAAAGPPPKRLQERILNTFTWDIAAVETLRAYHKILSI
jgi:glycosyltransferase involved in cell wall biosynthesis